MTWANRRRLVRSWPVWLFVAVMLGMAGAWHMGASSVERAPVAPGITVYVPAGPDVCRTESDCGTDWNGERWVIVPGEEGE